MRIARALALAGIDSRRKCEVYISNGAVKVNGEVVQDLGRQVDPDKDVILFRNRPLAFEKYVYFILNKPTGYTTTAADPHAKRTVFDLLPASLVPKTKQSGRDSRTRVFPVGRLDRDSTGLLLFTNDGELGHKLLHPRFEIGKWYEIRLDRSLDPRDGHRILEGIQLPDGFVKAERLKKLSRRVLRLLIREGKKREVRRIFEALNYEVIDLCRIAFGPILLENLPPGNGRFLKPHEIEKLKEAVSKSP